MMNPPALPIRSLGDRIGHRIAAASPSRRLRRFATRSVATLRIAHQVVQIDLVEGLPKCLFGDGEKRQYYLGDDHRRRLCRSLVDSAGSPQDIVYRYAVPIARQRVAAARPAYALEDAAAHQ